MPVIVEMPKLSDTMEEGTLIKWVVKVGDTVSAGDHLADVETDKATMELQAFDDGTVAKLVLDESATVPVGQAILILAEDGESVEDAANTEIPGPAPAEAASAPVSDEPETTPTPDPAPPAPATPAAAPIAPAASAAPAAVAPPPPPPGAKVKISPLARKLAEEHGLDVNKIAGTGPDGRIIKRDVLKAAEQGTARPSAGGAGAPMAGPAAIALESKTTAVPGMRKTIAKRLVESKTTVPHFQVSVAINMDPLMEMRATLNQRLASQGIKLSVNDFITRAVAVAAMQHPVINSSWMGDTIVQHGTVNVGTAISLPEERGGGLVVAVCRDVQNKSMMQISGEVKELAAAARGRGLSPEQMSDSTITISNLGMPQYGVTQFSAIVNPPNAAIIAVGAAIEKPVVRDVYGEKKIVIGHEMNATLSGDHRVTDGASAAEYLTTLRSLLENPVGLLV
ncbi:MAG: dihydrolipoamide acetyltransferase family protein [Planctomycetota bacterium]